MTLLENYLKDLVEGASCSDVQFVDDSSSSNILDLVDCDFSQRSQRCMDNSSSSFSSFDHERRFNCSPSSVLEPTACDSSNNDSTLDGFRERQRLIRMSMSPGVSSPTQSPRRRMRTAAGSPSKNKKKRMPPSSKDDDRRSYLTLKARLDGVGLFES